MGPHAPYTCPGGSLKEIIDEAKKLDVGIHIHVSETKEQVAENKKQYGNTPFESSGVRLGFCMHCPLFFLCFD